MWSQIKFTSTVMVLTFMICFIVAIKFVGVNMDAVRYGAILSVVAGLVSIGGYKEEKENDK